MKRFFVYGSLREGFYNYDKYLKGHVLTNELATTSGDLYHMEHKGYPALITGNRDIEGEVITVDNPEVLVKALDEMEHFYGLGNERNEYDRIEKEVKLLDGTIEICYVYFYVDVQKKSFDRNYIHLAQDSWKDYMINR
ncbi:gamma-glutamylcyclotransferase [uncultured Clostridium sp.]|uniref:gamma-glutamylcyclotransferase family protein n=1 Tax=uncultured Clostridium sp. TaxID=59620 RepID=UPI00260F196A|nr:gamma-glutamylcyclotransferase family protein [uncultured Clostridium sp.]